MSVKLYHLKISSVLFVLNVCFTVAGFGQKLNGEWYGVGKVKKAGDHNSYLSEMVLKQNGKNVTGQFNYFFRSAEIKTRISGTYDPRYKVLELKASGFSNCNMY